MRKDSKIFLTRVSCSIFFRVLSIDQCYQFYNYALSINHIYVYVDSAVLKHESFIISVFRFIKNPSMFCKPKSITLVTRYCVFNNKDVVSISC